MKKEIIINGITLRRVTKEELKEIRETSGPSFVAKINGVFYYTEMEILPDPDHPDEQSMFSRLKTSEQLNKPHACSYDKKCCRRLSAASDEKGGCAKVREHKGLDELDWITDGYETFNMKPEVFRVIKCSHYEDCPPHKEYTAKEIRNLRLGLAQFVWDDVTSMEEVRRRRERRRY